MEMLMVTESFNMKDNHFTDKERIRIVKLHVEEGKSQRILSLHYGVSQSSIGRWVAKYRNGKLTNKTKHGGE